MLALDVNGGIIMAFFGGPSKGVLLQMAQGVASITMQLQLLEELDKEAKDEVLSTMQAEGSPTSIQELIHMAAQVVPEYNMGWYKKNQYFGMIYGSLISMGMSHADANYIKGQIELLAH